MILVLSIEVPNQCMIIKWFATALRDNFGKANQIISFFLLCHTASTIGSPQLLTAIHILQMLVWIKLYPQSERWFSIHLAPPSTAAFIVTLSSSSFLPCPSMHCREKHSSCPLNKHVLLSGTLLKAARSISQALEPQLKIHIHLGICTSTHS